MFEVGWLMRESWDAQAAALACRMEAKNLRLWIDLSSLYLALQAYSIAGQEPPDSMIDRLKNLRNRLRMFDPPLRIRILRPLVSHRLTHWLARLLGRMLWDDNQVVEATYVLELEARRKLQTPAVESDPSAEDGTSSPAT